MQIDFMYAKSGALQRRHSITTINNARSVGAGTGNCVPWSSESIHISISNKRLIISWSLVEGVLITEISGIVCDSDETLQTLGTMLRQPMQINQSYCSSLNCQMHNQPLATQLCSMIYQSITYLAHNTTITAEKHRHKHKTKARKLSQHSDKLVTDMKQFSASYSLLSVSHG